MPGGASGPAGENQVKYREMGQESVSPSTPTRAPRRSLLPYVVLVVVTFFVTWFVFATITGLPVGLGPSPTARSPSGTPVTGVLMSIDNPFDTGHDAANNSSTDQYAPANFTVPANTLLEFTLINFDTGLNPVSSLEATVNQTVGNCIYLNSTPTSLGPCVHSVPATGVAHTFSFDTGPYAGFNVPLPSAVGSPEGSSGATVIFFAYFNQTGTFHWRCLAPCNGLSMATFGFMRGTMTVVAS
jgi:hypothetical protein